MVEEMSDRVVCSCHHLQSSARYRPTGVKVVQCLVHPSVHLELESTRRRSGSRGSRKTGVTV